MFSKASTKAKENRRVRKSFPILPFIIMIILVLVSKTKAVAAEIQETVVVVDQVYWIS
jgi:hypothetical protein